MSRDTLLCLLIPPLWTLIIRCIAKIFNFIYERTRGEKMVLTTIDWERTKIPESEFIKMREHQKEFTRVYDKYKRWETLTENEKKFLMKNLWID